MFRLLNNIRVGITQKHFDLRKLHYLIQHKNIEDISNDSSGCRRADVFYNQRWFSVMVAQTVFAQTHFLSILDTELDYIPQPPLQLGEAMWLSSGQWNTGRLMNASSRRGSHKIFPLSLAGGWGAYKGEWDDREGQNLRRRKQAVHEQVCGTALDYTQWTNCDVSEK